MQLPLWITGLLVLVGVLVGFVVAQQRERRQAGLDLEKARAELDAARNDAARLPDLLERAARAETQASQAAVRMQEALAAGAAAASSLESSKEQLLASRHRNDTDAQTLQSLRSQLADLTGQLARAAAERDAIAAAHQQTKAFLDEAQGRMRSVFIEAASKVFDEKAIALDEKIKASGNLSRESLEATLKPFQTRVEEFTAAHTRDQAKFTGTIDTLQKLNQDMTDATNSLARALKGNAKTRGDWGEMILETVLKASGLVEGSNYSRQAQSTDEESGKRRSPDVIVNLPDGRRVVVDSKVNLVAWTEANNAATPAEYDDAMLRHTTALRQHVRDLAEKNYPRVVGKDTLDLTVMFVPIEGALSAALSTNTDIQDEALSKRVVFASPNTLMAMLRVVERLWMRDKIQRQVELIGTEAGKMLDALTDFLDEFRAIQSQITRTQDAFDKANRRLHDSDRSVVKRAQRLVEAGAKGRKAIPESLQPVGGASAPLALDAGEADAETGHADVDADGENPP